MRCNRVEYGDHAQHRSQQSEQRAHAGDDFQERETPFQGIHLIAAGGVHSFDDLGVVEMAGFDDLLDDSGEGAARAAACLNRLIVGSAARILLDQAENGRVDNGGPAQRDGAFDDYGQSQQGTNPQWNHGPPPLLNHVKRLKHRHTLP